MRLLLELSPSVSLYSCQSGILVKGSKEPPNRTQHTPESVKFTSLLESLRSEGLLEDTLDGDLITTASMAEIEKLDFDPLAGFFQWCPFELKIQSSGTIGFPDFKFLIRFYVGKRLVSLNIEGIVARRSSQVYRLSASHALACALADDFNKRPASEKSKYSALSCLSKLKMIAGETNDLSFDGYLREEKVIEPTKMSLGVEDDGSRLVVFPIIDGVPETEIKKQFLNLSEVQNIYDINFGDGRQRLLLSPELVNIFREVKRKGFGISGEKRDQIMRNPRSMLSDIADIDPDLIDVAGFGPRVKGIGFPCFVRPTKNAAKENWFERNADASEKDDNPLSIECEYVNGDRKKIHFQSDEEASEFLSAARVALSLGSTSLEWGSESIPINERFIADCDFRFFSNDSELACSKKETKKKILLIHTNEQEQEYSEDTSQGKEVVSFRSPKALLPEIQLKAHQIAGIHWLQNLLANDLSKGCLLADDMGLGKTLQVLAFLSWCVETGLKKEIGQDLPPYEPILIIAPLILLDNWQKEIQKYFHSAVFEPSECLHGKILNEYRLEGSESSLDGLQKSLLNIDRIRSNRVIITNYDTLKNYQYSFAQVPWSVVVLDEAQEIKEPSTSVTYAAKALNPLFRIACTGTPIETSLTNLWSIMDFAQPGNPLGSLREFSKNFVGNDFLDKTFGEELRNSLRFNKIDGLVKRRTKKDAAKELPDKEIIVRYCKLEGLARTRYIDLLNHVSKVRGGQNAALKALQDISALVQHPFLIEDNWKATSAEVYIANCNKLKLLVEILCEIRTKKEKALIFVRSRNMQAILRSVIFEKFGIDSKILNGASPSKHKYQSNTRTSIVDSFSQSDGFNVLILSPEVAGVGLTITAANHVIHYGRWWNPAKENQATDRAYRIGQQKTVYVYHLILKDEHGELETFDEKLHRLLGSREEMADNFLIADRNETDVINSLARDIFESKISEDCSNPEIISNAQGLSPYQFEALCALLVAKKFSRVILTPRSGDRGVDVFCLSRSEIALIQCKMVSDASYNVSEDVLKDLVNASDYYRESVIDKSLRNLSLKLILMTTGSFDKATRRYALDNNVELIDGTGIRTLLGRTNISFFELKKTEYDRAKSMVDVVNLSKICPSD